MSHWRILTPSATKHPSQPYPQHMTLETIMVEWAYDPVDLWAFCLLWSAPPAKKPASSGWAKLKQKWWTAEIQSLCRGIISWIARKWVHHLEVKYGVVGSSMGYLGEGRNLCRRRRLWVCRSKTWPIKKVASSVLMAISRHPINNY